MGKIVQKIVVVVSYFTSFLFCAFVSLTKKRNIIGTDRWLFLELPGYHCMAFACQQVILASK